MNHWNFELELKLDEEQKTSKNKLKKILRVFVQMTSYLSSVVILFYGNIAPTFLIHINKGINVETPCIEPYSMNTFLKPKKL